MSEAVSRGWIGALHSCTRKLQQRCFCHDAFSGQILVSSDEFTWICLLVFWWPPSRTVAAIIVCCRDGDGRRPSLTHAEFEALDALGFIEQGGRNPIPHPICATNLTQSGQNTLNQTLRGTSACNTSAMSRLDVVSRCQSLVWHSQSADCFHQRSLLVKAVHESSQSIPFRVRPWK